MEKREEKQEEEEGMEPRFNAVTVAALREAEDIASGKIKVKTYSDLDEAFRDLKADDEEDGSCLEEKSDEK